MHLRWLPAGLVIVAGLVAWPGVAASASIGVGVQANPVSLDGAAHPGASYTLPALYVVNTGTQAESMTVRVERLAAEPGRAIPESWIHVSGLSGQLAPRQSARIPLRLVTPADARAGSYQSDIVVTGSVAPAAAGVHLGAAAATRLRFVVTPGPPTGSWLFEAAYKINVTKCRMRSMGSTGPNASFPITVTYTGLPGNVWISGSSAAPADSGASWSLCNPMGQPACTGGQGLPGKNQYAVSTFGAQVADFSVLTGSAACDNEFNPGSGCSAAPAQFQSQTQHEGVQLTGPKTWDDGSTSWSVSITWIAESPG